MGRFWKHTNGSASVYLMIVLVPIFLFQALFADLIRLQLAQRENELALKAALRSVMSRYDRTLAGYGLFGLRWEESGSVPLYLDYLNRNLAGGEGYRYLDLQMEQSGSGIEPVYTLANPEVLKRQIVQEMKLKAPVEFITELLDKFQKSKADQAMSQAKLYSDSMRELEKLHWKREEALDKAWEKAQAMLEHVEGAGATLSSNLTRLTALAGQIGDRTEEQVLAAVSDAERTIQSLNERIRQLQQSMLALSMAMASLTGQEGPGAAESLMSAMSAVQNELNAASTLLSEQSANLAKLKQTLADMAEYALLFASSKQLVSATEQKLDTDYRALGAALDQAEELQGKWLAELERYRAASTADSQLSENLLLMTSAYDMAYFSRYKTEAARIPAALHGLALRWAEQAWWNTSQWSKVAEELQELSAFSASFKSSRASLEAERQARNDAARNEEEQERQKIGNSLAEIRKAVTGCSTGSGEIALYAKLGGPDSLAAKYSAYSKLAAAPPGVNRPAAEADTSVDLGMDIIGKFSGFLAGLRDELFINEYALDKFNYRTWGKGEAAPNEGLARSKPGEHPLVRQEAEYLLYGFNSCDLNLGAAYGEMFLLFLGIRTAEALMEPSSGAAGAVAPLVALLKAAAEGAVRAVQDMHTLTGGGAVSLFQKLGAFKVTYKDMLRVIFMLHPNQTSVLIRMQALLELNTGVDLTRTTTYVQGTSAASVNMWFLPGVLKAIEKTGAFNLDIEEGRSRFRQTAVYAYD
ncbi:hypothetical protein [Paenibacillus sp. YN15]|uniref:hypothetical protein n=1 Tax=Paenibacillus sp. YN15 TaxID=1742774 RepID=UPI0011BFB519|nr:hypothetical protein [Paenibacillus sp. YN15]